MKYHIKASSLSNEAAVMHIKHSTTDFGTAPKSAETLPNSAVLLLGSFASCILKNVERFSAMIKFTYSKATIEVNAIRLENLSRMGNVVYNLTIQSNDKKLKSDLLKKNIENFGTIYNTVKLPCSVSDTINTIKNV